MCNDITRAGRWAHARRKFVDAEKTHPAIAREAVTLIGRLYAIEDQGRTRSSEDRLVLRQAQSTPILRQLHPPRQLFPARWGLDPSVDGLFG